MTGRYLGSIAVVVLAAILTSQWSSDLRGRAVHIGVLWLVAGSALLALLPHRRVRVVLVNALAVVAALTVFEWRVTASAATQRDGAATHLPGFISKADADVLGYGPTPGFVDHSQRVVDGRPLYDVHYTIDSHGLRVAPPERDTVIGTMIVFGCSFTFGEGVDDEQTMPYRIGVRTNGRYRVYNFGFSGYGPHQMLSAIEHGLVDRIVRPIGPVTVVYQAIPDHVNRAAGVAPWNSHYPRYVLDAAGVPQFAGRFDDSAAVIAAVPGIKRVIDAVQPTSEKVELYGAIVARAQQLLKARYAGASFVALYWNRWENASTGAPGAELRRRSIRVDDITLALPSLQSHEEDWLIPADGHPNARAHDAIASYVVEHILPGAARAP